MSWSKMLLVEALISAPWPSSTWAHSALYNFLHTFNQTFFHYYYFFLEREKRGGGGKQRERNIYLLFHLFMHSLVDSCTCPEGGLNPQPWRVGMML